MKFGGLLLGALVLIGAGMTALIPAPQAARDGFTFAEVTPGDVFLYVAGRHNPERKFLDDYWAEVFEALAQSGVGQDALDLLGSLVGAEAMSEVNRLKERATELAAAVNWQDLAGREFAFTERFGPFPPPAPGTVPFMIADMVWLFRGTPAGATQNHAGLVAILDALAEELNRATGSESLVVERVERHGTQLARLNVLALAPGAPALPLTVGRRDDVVLVALGDRLLDDTLSLMAGAGSKPALGADPRFRAAFAQLPPPEDSLTFFDLHALLRPLKSMLSTVIELAQAPSDVYENTELTPAQNKLNAQALAAYQRGEIAEALALIEKLHESAPDNALVLYNLACFNALKGNRDAALDALEKAVAGGFYAPSKIASDSDLDSLREHPRYKAALAQAGERSAVLQADDVIVNSSKTGEAYTLTMQAWQAYEQKEYERGLKFLEQAYAVAPADARVLYALACFHAVLGHEDKALSFLEQAVAGGFYSPRHIAGDPDLKSLRDDPRYAQALKLAREKAAEHSSGQTGGQVAWVRVLFERLTDAVGVLDYVAAVEHTEGYSVRTETVTSLVPDAKSRPIYPVIASKPPLTGFDRFLPEETLSFSVAQGIDPQALYRFLEDSVRALGEPGEELLAGWAEVQRDIGVDVQRDVLGWLDGGGVSVTLADDRGSVWLLNVTDEELAREKIGAAIEFVTTKLPEVVSENPALGPLALMATVHTAPVNREDLPGFQSLQFAMLPQPAVWGVAEGHLVLASSADAAALCLATARGTHPNIRKNTRAMSEALLPEGPFASVTLTDQRKLGEEFARGLGIASMVTGMMGSFIPEPQVRAVLTKITGIFTKLTPVVRKIDFYKSTASVTTFDGLKWHTRQVTHYFPPAERPRQRTAEPAPATAPAP